MRRHLVEIERAEELSAKLRLLARTAKVADVDELRTMIDEGRAVGVSHKVMLLNSFKSLNQLASERMIGEGLPGTDPPPTTTRTFVAACHV